MDADLRARVARARVARMATIRPSGEPHLVPVTFALEGATIVTAVDHKPKSTTELQRLANLEANPLVSVLVDHYDEDWSRLWWARADGDARILRDGDGRQEVLGPLVDKYPQYREEVPQGPVIVVTVTRWASWQA